MAHLWAGPWPGSSCSRQCAPGKCMHSGEHPWTPPDAPGPSGGASLSPGEKKQREKGENKKSVKCFWDSLVQQLSVKSLMRLKVDCTDVTAVMHLKSHMLQEEPSSIVLLSLVATSTAAPQPNLREYRWNLYHAAQTDSQVHLKCDCITQCFPKPLRTVLKLYNQ